MRKFGAHVSIAGGLLNSFDRIKNIGGNCMQIFSCSPRDWKNSTISDELAAEFLKIKLKDNIDPIYFHANYLINLSNDLTGELSKKSLIYELKLAAKLGIKGSVVHLGSFFDRDTQTTFTGEKYHLLLANIQDILDQSPKESLFTIENSGTKKIGRTIEEIGFITKRLPDLRVKVCLDTCHLHAAGYDLSTTEKLDIFLDLFDKTVGISKLELIHANDSRDMFASGRDRHENLGQGKVGNSVFVNMLNHKAFVDVPFIMETPGFDGKGPDKQNLEILARYISYI